MTPGQVRRWLDQLGDRRKKEDQQGEKTAEDIRKALAAAKVAGVPMTEAAERLDLNRTTLYQVYLDAETTPGNAAPAAG